MDVGIRELKQRTSELIRIVREEGRIIQITYHGKVVARIYPVQQPLAEENETSWQTLEQIADEIGRSWPEGVSAVEAIEEYRS
jgi:prevent-host-death family protein